MSDVVAPKGYKKTKVGVIPEEWKKYSFDDIFIFSAGKNIKQNEASPKFNIPCIRYGELYYMYNEIITKVINRTNVNKSELLFSKGDEILLPSAGEDPLDIGSASALTLKNIAIGRTINILRPKKENIYSQKYMAYFINHQLKRKIASLAKGSSISNVYNSDLKKIKIPLPPLKEQEKIAKILTTWDKAISKQERLINAKERLKKGLMQKLLSGEVRFEEFSEEWNKMEFELIFERIPSKKYQITSNEYFEVGKYPIVDQGKKEIIGYSNETEKVLKNKGIIIFGDHTRVVKYVDYDFIVGADGTQLLRTKEDFDNKFFYYQLSNKKIPNTGYNRHFKFIKDMVFKVPPKQEQQKISKVLSTADKEIELLKNELESLKEQKKGLMQRLLIGRVRVKV